MTFNWFDQLSDWNPQVFRELKGRLKQRYVILAIVGSLTTQLFVLLSFWSLLPTKEQQSNTYCTGGSSYQSFECLPDAFGNPQINWQSWWWDLFQTLSWTLPGVLLIAGVYLLLGDLGKEERRGTLNFIRLSPQTSQSILLGKLLGVPVVPYLAVALAVPFHLIAAKSASVSLGNILSIYLLTAAACACAYSAALLVALCGVQNWVGAVAMAIVYTTFYHVLSESAHGQLQWFNLNVGHYYDFGQVFALLTLGSATYWFWQAANRRFRNPTVTLLSKRQSYGMTLCFEVWLLGFVFRDMSEYSRPFEDLVILGFFNLLWFVMLVAAMTPQRQVLLDWARYRRERVVSAKKFWSRSRINDLLWGEKSPAVVAIALNLVIAFAVVVPWVLSWEEEEDLLRGLATILLGAMYALLCATINQLMVFMKAQKWAIGAASASTAILVMPPVMFTMLQPIVPITIAFAAFLGHLAILSSLSFSLTRQLRRAGESEMKALLLAGRS